MVTISNYAVRINSDASTFVALILQGDLEMVQSKETGKFYATARTTSISSTFDEKTAALMVGKQLPGSIIKQQCEPYEYKVPESGELITLAHSYVYSPVEQTVVVATPTVQPLISNLNPFSSNGKHAFAEA
jgi:uncharacterized protein YaaQ